MPLNISIDVDGTLLDEDENVHPQTRNLIEQFKAEGHRIQLWSTGGADYALRRATEKGLADLFDSFGAKPDVAIDDIPESAHSVVTLKVHKSFGLVDAMKLLKSKVEDCVESALCPSPALVKHVAKIQSKTEDAKRTYKKILREKVSFHPIPFFGNVSTARIITIGLNPSSGEFEPWRCWPEELDAQELALRLVGYFRHAQPRPHPWFAELQEALSIVNCPYTLAAAHVDVSPWPTLSPNSLKKRINKRELLAYYHEMILTERKHLGAFLQKCKNLKFVFIIGKENFGSFDNDWTRLTKESVRQGFQGRVEVVEKHKLSKWISDHEGEIRELTDLPPNIC
jgi:hypothetical protein